MKGTHIHTTPHCLFTKAYLHYRDYARKHMKTWLRLTHGYKLIMDADTHVLHDLSSRDWSGRWLLNSALLHAGHYTLPMIDIHL